MAARSHRGGSGGESGDGSDCDAAGGSPAAPKPLAGADAVRLSGSSALTQMRVLLKKQWLFALRGWKATAGQLATPLLVVVLLMAFQALSDSMLMQETPHPAPMPIGLLPKCTSGGPPCKTLRYAPRSAKVEALLRHLADSNGLSFEQDFEAVPGVRDMDKQPCGTNLELCFEAFEQDNSTLTHYMLEHPNATQNIVHFTSAYYPTDVGLPSGLTAYLLYFNYSMTQYPFFEDPHALSLKRALDEAVAETLSGNDMLLNVSYKHFPTPKPRIAGYDAVAANGGAWMFLPGAFTFFVILVSIVQEKEQRLRLGLRQAGMRTWVYWFSWVTYSVTFNALTTVILMVGGWAADFAIINNASPYVVFLMLWSFGISLSSIAIFLSTIIGKVKTAQTVGYTLILMAFVFQTILCSAYGGLIDLLYLSDVAWWVHLLLVVFESYPPFLFAKVFYDVATRSSPIIDVSEGKITQGPGFFWDDLFVTRNVTFFKLDVIVPPTVQQLDILLCLAAAYVVAALYLDSVIAGDQGTGSHPLLCLSPRNLRRLCGCKRGEKAEAHGLRSRSAARSSEGERDEGVVDEEMRVLSGDVPEDAAVVVRGLTRTFPGQAKGCCGHRRGQMVKAVNDVSLVVRVGEVCALLGHNGAGKTTLLNCLSGTIAPTSGNATIFGMDVETDVRTLQRSMGFVPQFDALFPYMTAAETLSLFSSLKGVKSDAIAGEVDKRLKEVGLHTARDRIVDGFSGGMKRRMSLAIAAIGDPLLLFLDEMSAGLDPVNRRDAWKVVQSMRAGRAILLTSHLMAEVDALSDRVAVMAGGKLRAVGNPLALKRRYGSGYRVTVVSEAARVPDVLREVRTRLPGGVRVMNVDAGSLALGVSFEQLAELPPLLGFLEDEGRRSVEAAETGAAAAESTLVKEWGISFATMEEAFLEISKRAGFRSASTGLEKSVDSDDEATLRWLQDAAAEGGGDGLDAADDSKADDAEAVQEDDDGKVHGGDTTVFEPAHGRAPGSYPWRALVRKNLTLWSREKAQCFCQVMTPLVVLGILVLLRFVIDSEIGSSVTAPLPTLPIPLNLNLLHNPEKRHEWLEGKAFGGPFSGADAINGTEWLEYDVDEEVYRLVGAWPASHAFGVSPLGAEGDALLRRMLVRSVVGAERLDELASGKPRPVNTSLGDYPGDDCVEFFLVAPAPFRRSEKQRLVDAVGELNPWRSGDDDDADDDGDAGLLGNIPQTDCEWRGEDHHKIYVPYFESVSNETALDDIVFSDLEFLNTVDSKKLQDMPYPAYRTPDGTVGVHGVDNIGGHPHGASTDTPMRLAYTFNVNDNVNREYHRPNNFTRLGLQHSPRWLRHRSLLITPGRLALMELLDNAYLGYKDLQPELPPEFAALGLNFVATMPENKTIDYLVIVEVFGSFLFPIALTLQLPIFVFMVALERELGLQAMQKMHGLRHGSYTMTTFVLNFAVYVAAVAAFWIGGVVLDFRFFTETSFTLLLLIFVGWGLSLVAMGFFIGSFVNSRMVATVVSYVIALFGNLISIMLSDVVYGNIPPFSLGISPPMPLLAFPLFSFVRVLYITNFACSVKSSCFSTLASVPEDHEIWGLVTSLYVDFAGIMLLALYLDRVLPHKHSVPAHPLFCVPSRTRAAVKQRCGCGSRRAQQLKERLRSVSMPIHKRSRRGGRATEAAQPLLDGVTVHGSDDSMALMLHPYSADADEARAAMLSEDQDVAQERRSVLQGDGDDDSVIVIRNLRRAFGSKVAVKDMCLSVKRGECLGLLGENGAGKSTTISQITGQLLPTAGSITVAGFDVVQDVDAVSLCIGVTPQHDRLWPTLTVAETLLFYARLKGVAPSTEAAYLEAALTSVNLQRERDRLTSKLSGGMRRRLSVAIALTPGSRVTLLDEPSAGLDPASRRRLWRILARARERATAVGRAFVVTTHDMEEAEVLCAGSRICIMVDGELRCIGTPQHLKRRFGRGHRLAINYRVSDESRVLASIREMFPAATLDASFRGFATFMLPQRGGASIADAFQAMHERAAGMGITDWSVGQVGLEDVFQRIVTTDRAEPSVARSQAEGAQLADELER